MRQSINVVDVPRKKHRYMEDIDGKIACLEAGFTNSSSGASSGVSSHWAHDSKVNLLRMAVGR